MSLRTIIKHLHCHHHYLIKPLASSRSLSSIATYPPPRPPSHVIQNHNQEQDPYSLLKEDPIQICSSLWVKTFSSPPDITFPNLTGFLSKLDLWVLAYQRSCAQVTGTFPPRNAIHSHVLSDLLSLRNVIVHSQFFWNKKIQQYIRSPNDKPLTRVISKRKLQAILESDEPCFQDRVVQEVLLMVLEPVFEARFSPKSHAFRPGRNAHTVIRTIRSNFAGYLWFLKGDLSEIFDNVDGSVVLGCVEKAVKDKKVLGLIKSALKGRVRDRSQLEIEDKEELRKKKKKKQQSKKKKILNENEPKPDPYWLRTFFNFAPKEAAKCSRKHASLCRLILVREVFHKLEHFWLQFGCHCRVGLGS